MSFFFIYLIGVLVMAIYALLSFFKQGEVKLSDLIVLPIVSMLSIGGIAVLIVIRFCEWLERVMDASGKNKVYWKREE